MSWNQLRDIIFLNRRTLQEHRQLAPITCPIDGATLDIHPRLNIRNCPLGNYRWPAAGFEGQQV